MSTITTTQLQQQYIAYFGRPGDPAGIKYWLASGLTETQFAAQIHAHDEYQKSTVGEKSTEDQVNNLYKNLFGRSADATGLLYWTGEVEAGRSSIADLAVKLINSAKNPSTGDETQGAADAAALAAKTASAEAFTTDVEADAAAILAYQPESEGETWKAGAAYESAVTFLAGISSTDATEAEVDAAVTAMSTASTPATTGETKSLTTGVDSFTGTANNDTYVASETTFGAGDTVTGGEGTDTLSYSSTGTVAVTESGFTTTGVETYKLTSTTTGGTTVNATGATGVTKIINTASTTDLSVTGVKALTTVEIDSTSAGNTTVRFDDGLLTGTADSLTLNFANNTTTAAGSIGTITVGNTTGGGVETLNVNSTTAASLVTAVVSGATTINVTGDANLTVDNVLTAATTVDATNFTGNLSVVLDSAGTARDVSVTGGTGDDTADFTAGFEASDVFTGGDGTDSIRLTQAVASGAIAGTLTGVEQLNVSDAGTGIIDMDSFSGVTKVIYDAGISSNLIATVDDAVTGITVEVDAANAIADDGSLVVDLKTDGSDDAITVVVDAVGAGEGIASINAADAETLTISVDDDTTDATGTFTIASLTASDATKIVLSGDSAITLTNTVDPTTPVLATFDAGAVSDVLTLSATNFVSTGATITLGSANDVFTLATATGADTIDLSKGGDDRIVYTAVAQSDSDTDTIKGFTSGSDDIDLRTYTTAITTSGQFAGSQATFGASQGALTATRQAVFQVDTNTLWVDNGDLQLDGSDFRVILEGVTSIAATDLALDTGINATSNQAAFNTATSAHFTEGSALTNEADTLDTTVAHLAGSTLAGLAGDDTINITGTGAFNTSGITFGGFETMTLGGSVTGVTVAVADTGTAGELATITGTTGTTQTLTLTDSDDLTGVELRRIETITSTSGDAVTFTMDEDNFTNVTSLLFPGVSADVLALSAGTYDFSNQTTTFGNTGSSITFAGAAALTADALDLNNVTIITGNGTNAVQTTLTLNDTDTFAGGGITEIDTFVVNGANQTLTLDGDDMTVMAGADTLGMTFTGSGTSNLVAAAGGTAAALSLVDYTITGFDSINVDAAAEAKDFTIDAASIAGTGVTITGDAQSNWLITETGDYTGLITASGSHDSIVLTDGITATVDEATLDADGTVTSAVAINSTGATDANLAINMVGTTLDLGAVTVGAIQDVDTVITGTTGNDIITAYDASTAGSATTIDGNGGGDIFRLEDSSGNAYVANSAAFTATLADAVTINNFDATNDTISFATADITVNSAGTAAKDAWNSTSGDGFALLSGTTLTDFTSEAGFYSAVGNMTLADNAVAAVALSNASGSQVGIYTIDAQGAVTGALSTDDSISLVAVVNVTNGTFSVSNMAIH